MKQRTKQQSTVVAIEICRSQLHAVILRPVATGTGFSVHTHSVPWRKEATSLLSEVGAKELAVALRQIVAAERIGGLHVSFCLNSDFCITRAVSGANSDVRHELTELEERSSLYLSLGAGPKALAHCIRQIDARHQHALLAVTNKRALDTILHVAEEVGLKVDRIEPSLVSLGRLIAHTGRDSEPVLLIALSEDSVEFGISYQGQLLLEYRPGGRSANDEVAGLVEQHLPRLDRYCQRYLHLDGNRLQHVFLVGSPDAVVAAQAGFDRQQNLRVDVLDPTRLESGWQFGDARPNSQIGAALGLAVIGLRPESRSMGPNFMERVLAEARERLWPALWRSAWPVAAALLIALGLVGLDVYQKLNCNKLTAQLDQLSPVKTKIAALQEQMTTAATTIRHLQGIRERLSSPNWVQTISMVGHCLPEDVWLVNMSSTTTGRLNISGASYDTDGVYEFVRWLQKTPGLSDVALEQAQPTSIATGPATGFDVSVEFAGDVKSAGEGK